MQYDLEGRTLQLSKDVVLLVKRVNVVEINRNIVSQLLRSVTSVGANYREANGGSSRKDFKNKIYICRKEIQETKYWVELLATTNPEVKEDLRKIWRETHELTLIFNKITTTLNNIKD